MSAKPRSRPTTIVELVAGDFGGAHNCSRWSENGGGDVLSGSRPGRHSQRGDGTVVSSRSLLRRRGVPSGSVAAQRSDESWMLYGARFVVRGVNVNNGMADKQVAHGVGGRRSPQ